MAYRAIRAAPELARDVDCLWELAGPAALLHEPVFPDGRAEIVLHLTPPPRARGHHAPQPRLMVAGQMRAAVHLEAGGFVHVVGVRFTPLGARRWLQAPMHLFTDRFLPLADVRPELASRLEAAVGGSPSTRYSTRCERPCGPSRCPRPSGGRLQPRCDRVAD